MLLSIFAAVCAIVAGFWAVGHWAMTQFERRLDERFATQEVARLEGRRAYEHRLTDTERELRELHTAFLKHLAELPRDYMRREDHIRFETTINAKLDALSAKQDLVVERLPRRE